MSSKSAPIDTKFHVRRFLADKLRGLSNLASQTARYTTSYPLYNDPRGGPPNHLLCAQERLLLRCVNAPRHPGTTPMRAPVRDDHGRGRIYIY